MPASTKICLPREPSALLPAPIPKRRWQETMVEGQWILFLISYNRETPSFRHVDTLHPIYNITLLFWTLEIPSSQVRRLSRKI